MKTLLKNEVISYIREPFASFFSIALPILLVFIYGDAFGKYEYNDVLSGYDMSILFNIVFLLGNLGLMGLVMTMIEKRISLSSKRDQVLPINNFNKFILNVFSSIVLAIIITLIIIILNYWMYPITLNNNILFIPAYIIILFNFFAIGYNIATLPVSPRTAQTIGILIFFSCLFFSGLVIPFDNSKPILNTISLYSPFRVSLSVMTAVADIENFFTYNKHLLAIVIYTVVNTIFIISKGRINNEIK
ncbi:ABC transporter permease [Mammaliicoccus lentus]|uniref:ABC transporter permease n=1 Tax=Mammaliicoccus lentus TaxID=42858 RepID=UPI001B334FAC|nr:ABC transporter permease [Mammaliicoccus lentus]